ncbi:hypothetical protein TMEN_3262 [Trichophyton mentagrophytes]|nr:hypothetical protein TMEN_3262 [Trichophyton mentagrophytes]
MPLAPVVPKTPGQPYAFERPECLGWYLIPLFKLYISYAPDSFPCDWLEKTEDIKVKCIDGTGDKVEFPTPPELLKAIRKCENVNHPEKGPCLPNNWHFSGFMQGGAYEVLRAYRPIEHGEFCGPMFNKVHRMVYHSYPCIKGVQLFYHEPNHWSCIMRDHSSAFEPSQVENDPRSYLLRSELLAAISIFYRQMHDMVWNPRVEKYKPILRYKEGFLTATVVTFIYGQVRVVQASIKPSETYPTITFTLRAIYDLNEDYDKEVAYTVLQWILSPPKPAEVD